MITKDLNAMKTKRFRNFRRTLSFIAFALLLAIPSRAQSLPSDTTHYAASRHTLTEGQMNKEQVTNPLEAINGRVAGLSISRTGNGTAAMSAVRLRGTTSLTGGNDPLIIIDGVMGDLATLSGIYPADIESFTVLKDASETAGYGSRGASGVIEVVTKKGSAAGARITYNGSFGVTSVYKNLNMLDAGGYRNEILARDLMLIDHGYNTNWQKEIEQTGVQQDHHIAFTGGNTDNGYRVALGFMDRNGIIKHDNLRHFTSNMSMYQRMFGNLLRIDVGMFGNISRNITAVYDVQKTFYSAQSFNPTFAPQRNDDGNYDGFTYANQISHPLALIDSRTRDNTTHISTHAKLTFNITPEFSATLFGAYSHNEVETSQFLPTTIWAHGQAYKASAKTNSLLGNVKLNYIKSIDKHRINLSALGELQRDILTGFHTTTTNFTDNSMGYNSIQSGAIVSWAGTGSYRYAPSLSSIMGNVNYAFDNRYNLSAGLRADASSKFGSNHKWGYFPSVSASWAISNEAFMASTDAWLQNLALHVGYGLSGNQGGIDSYMSLNVYSPSAVAPIGQQAIVTLENLRNSNPDLKWETKRTFNIGLDASVLNNRLFTAIEFYTAKTTDMLYMYDVSTPPFPFKSLLANLGAMRNRGLEISLGFTPLLTTDMELNINSNVTFQQTELLSLSGRYGDYEITGPAYKDIASINGAGFHGGFNHIVYQVVGKPLGVFYLPHCNGLMKTDNGYVYDIADIDGDGVINLANGADRQICGQAIPKVLLGTNISFRYRDFDITLQINGAFGHKIYNGTALTYMNMNSLPGYNVLNDAPEMNITDQTATDYWLENGDYVNLDYLTIGYNIPLNRRARKVINQLRVAITASNLATITGYSGLTPMINTSTVNSTLGLDDKNIYPLSRTYTIGMSISF